jgi:hypothetical protein
MAARKKFGELTARAKARAYAAGGRFDLSKRAVAARYNAGTYNPFARKDPLMRLPAEYRSEPVITEAGTYTVDWRALAVTNITYHLQDNSGGKFNPGRVRENVARAPEKIQRIMARASMHELSELAHIQNPTFTGEIPFNLDAWQIGYITISQKTGEHEWHNLFWYH